MQSLIRWAAGVAFAVTVPTLVFAAQQRPLGWSEVGAVMPEKSRVNIELDTSAEKSSLIADHIEPFERAGESWVRFTLPVPQGLTNALVDTPFERKVVGSEKVKGLIGSGGRRQIVKMDLCIGTQLYSGELSLKAKGKKDFSVILGRDALQHLGPVDASSSHTLAPQC